MNGDLRQKWRVLLPASPAAEAVCDDLLARYSEPTRFYHTLSHLRNLLFVTHALRALVPPADWPAVQFAVWFHDAIYDARASDNEEKSAKLAENELGKLGVKGEIIEKTTQLIRATKTHASEPGETACDVLLDADLSVLGASETEYDTYAKSVRQEYAWVAEVNWRAGRSRVLESFLTREKIYQTQEMRQTHEAVARANLTRELARLTDARPDVL